MTRFPAASLEVFESGVRAWCLDLEVFKYGAARDYGAACDLELLDSGAAFETRTAHGLELLAVGVGLNGTMTRHLVAHKKFQNDSSLFLKSLSMIMFAI